MRLLLRRFFSAVQGLSLQIAQFGIRKYQQGCLDDINANQQVINSLLRLKNWHLQTERLYEHRQQRRELITKCRKAGIPEWRRRLAAFPNKDHQE